MATDYFYKLSQDTNYIRRDRIKKDVKWKVSTEYGTLDITINLSKPEKDPRDIAAALKASFDAYPKCALCKENEGFAGSPSQATRQNHRLIPIPIGNDICNFGFSLSQESDKIGQIAIIKPLDCFGGKPPRNDESLLDGTIKCNYYFQYSPYVYYNEHCIVLSKDHTPMKISRGTFSALLDFVTMFPHYTLGSNADLPIVGGSILTHDHYQGGCYEFPMARAECERRFKIAGVSAAVVKWPMSVIRLSGYNKEEIGNAADKVLNAWRVYSDESVGIYSNTGGTPHNTITPIARVTNQLTQSKCAPRSFPFGKHFHSTDEEQNNLPHDQGVSIHFPQTENNQRPGEAISPNDRLCRFDTFSASGKHSTTVLPKGLHYELDLVLRNNITTDEHPLGVFHPHEELHHIKKENIGLIEVMGLAILPGRLKEEMETLARVLVSGGDVSSVDSIKSHAKWAKTLPDMQKSDIDDVKEMLRREIGKVFLRVLEDAGVFKRDSAGVAAFNRFLSGIE